MDLTSTRSGGKPDSIMRPTLLSFFALAASAAAQEPLQLASNARLWLQVPAGAAPLKDIRVSSGNASQAPWEKDPAIRERQTDILFPVRWWK